MPRKPNPFILSLNQPAKGPHLHGKHRRTSPAAHGDPADRTSAGAGRSRLRTSLPSPAWRTFNFSTGTVTPLPSGGGASLTLADYAELIKELYPEKPEPLPYAGIHTGEIISHRAWWVLPDGMYSLVHRFRWEPGATVSGDLNKIVMDRGFMLPIWGGVYAFSTASETLTEELGYRRDTLTWSKQRRYASMSHDCPGIHAIGLVRGTVKLWGEVIEHVYGYRAQFAKLHSIVEWWGDPVRVPEVLEPYYATLTKDKQ